jgi:hypothetical protein
LRTLHIKNSTQQILDLIEPLINQVRNLQPHTEIEKKFKNLLIEMTNGIAGEFFVIQDLLIDSDEIPDSEIVIMLQDFEAIIN